MKHCTYLVAQKNIPTPISSLVGRAGLCLHSFLVRSIFEMSLAIPKPIFKKKFPQELMGEIRKLSIEVKLTTMKVCRFPKESLWKFFLENWLRYCQGVNLDGNQKVLEKFLPRLRRAKKGFPNFSPAPRFFSLWSR